jgi:hypothetical protein
MSLTSRRKPEIKYRNKPPPPPESFVHLPEPNCPLEKGDNIFRRKFGRKHINLYDVITNNIKVIFIC